MRRVEPQRRFVIRDRIRESPLREPHVAEIGVRSCMPRLEADRLGIVRRRLVEPTRLLERGAEVVVAHGGGPTLREHPLPQGHPGLPRPELLPRAERQRGGHQHRGHRGDPPRARPAHAGHEVSDAPHEDHEDTHQRDVGVAIGHGLLADPHDPDHGRERHPVPQPAGQQVRPTAAEPHRCAGQEGEQDPLRRRLRHRRVERIRIERREARRPQRLLEVAGVPEHRVREPRRERRVAHRPDRSLSHHRRDARGHRHRDERQLLEHPRPPRR